MPISKLNVLILNHRIPEYRFTQQHLSVVEDAAKGAKVKLIDRAEAAAYITDCDILATWIRSSTNELISNAPNLKWVHAFTAGIEELDLKKIQSSDIIVTNSKGVGDISVSEHVLAMILNFTRLLNVCLFKQKERVWELMPSGEIYEKTLGIIGLGSIGRTIAKKAKALGMRVLAVNRGHSNELFVDKMYISDSGSILEVFAKSDFIVVCLPLTEDTKDLIGIEHFKAMKSSAYFFNIARGGVVREEDLITALKDNLIKGAGLDVFSTEPLPPESPLWDMPNVIITPHMASSSPAYIDRAVKIFADNLKRYLEGAQLINIIDKERGY